MKYSLLIYKNGSIVGTEDLPISGLTVKKYENIIENIRRKYKNAFSGIGLYDNDTNEHLDLMGVTEHENGDKSLKIGNTVIPNTN